MRQEQTRLVDLVSDLRWAVPVVIALAGAGYAVLELVVVQGHEFTEPEVIRSTLFLGLVGPILAWLTLTWATKAANAEAVAQEKLARRNRELAVLSAVGKAASQSLDLDEILRTALEKMVGLIGLEASDIWLHDGDHLTLRAHYGVSDGFVTDHTKLGAVECLCGGCARHGETIYIPDLGNKADLAHIPCQREGFESVLSVPMQAKGHVVGVIHVASRRRDAFSSRDAHILQAVGQRLAAAIENARLYEETRRQALQLAAASQVSRRVTAILDVDDLLVQVVGFIQETLKYDHVNLFLVDAPAGELMLRESSGEGGSALKARGMRLALNGPGITARVAQTGHPFLCNDVSQEPLYLADALLAETQSELALPLRIGDVIVGVLDIESKRRHAFREDDIPALQILADQVAIALENAHLFRQMRHQYDTLRTLHDISLDITARLDHTQVIDIILAQATRLLHAQASSIAVLIPDTGENVIMADYNFTPSYRGARLGPGEGAAGYVIATGQPLIVNDYPQWTGRASVFHTSPYDAILSVPLRWRDHVYGALAVLDQGERRPFVKDDVRILSLFADLASIALKNAELYDQVLQLSHDLEQKVEERTFELAIARADVAQKAEQLQRLLASTIRIQEEERARIAQDLHDGSNQLVTGTLYQIQAAQQTLAASNQPFTLASLDTAKDLLREIAAENRRIISGLRPSILDTQGLVAAVKWHAGLYQQRNGLTCHVKVCGSSIRLLPEVETAIYRIVQESLNNVASHAEAHTVHITLNFRPDRLQVQVEDDGVGFVPAHVLAASTDNLGIIGMRERAESIGGQLEIQSQPEAGTRIRLEVPLQPAAQPHTAMAIR